MSVVAFSRRQMNYVTTNATEMTIRDQFRDRSTVAVDLNATIPTLIIR